MFKPNQNYNQNNNAIKMKENQGQNTAKSSE